MSEDYSLKSLNVSEWLSTYIDPLGVPYLVVNQYKANTSPAILIKGTSTRHGVVSFQDGDTRKGQVQSGVLFGKSYSLIFEMYNNPNGICFSAYTGVPMISIDNSANIRDYNGVSMLNPTTLGSAIKNSSLTSVGTLNQLNVSTFMNAPTINPAYSQVKIATNAGLTGQGANSIAIGNQAGFSLQGANSVAIGSQAGFTGQHDNTVILNAGGNTLNSDRSDALFINPIRNTGTDQVLYYNSSTKEVTYSTAFADGLPTGGTANQILTKNSGTDYDSYWSSSFTGTNGIFSGYIDTPTINPFETEVKIAKNAGQTNQGANSIAVGNQAGQTSQATNSIAIGLSAGNSLQQANSIAIGNQAGFTGQGRTSTDSIAIGSLAGSVEQGGFAIAVGFQAGRTGQANNSISVGRLAGLSTQSDNAIAIGRQAGQSVQGNASVAIGYQAGETTQGASSVAVGVSAGNSAQGASSVAIGNSAGLTTQGTRAVAIGYRAGENSQAGDTVAVGVDAGRGSQQQFAIAIGYTAGFTGQNINTVAIGRSAGNAGQGAGSVAIGYNAGQTTQAINSVAVGNSAGSSTQQANSIAVGSLAGQAGQNTQAIAIGRQAGQSNQGTLSVAVGYNAGNTNQQTTAVAIGSQAGYTNQNLNAVSIGNSAGNYYQRANTVAVGTSAGAWQQGANSVAIGNQAGFFQQRENDVAIGSGAGFTGQQSNSVAIGSLAGNFGQGANSIAIGTRAGMTGQGANAVAIGPQAGSTGATGQHDNTIILNAGVLGLNSDRPDALFISPIRSTGSSQALYYNTTTKEITSSNVLTLSGIIDATRSTGASNQFLTSNFSGSSLLWKTMGYASIANTNSFYLSANTATPIGYDTTFISKGVSYTGSQITFSQTGVYKIGNSLSLDSANTTLAYDIWFSKNGTDIPNSASSITVKKNGEPIFAYVEIFESVNSGDYVEILIATESPDGHVLASGAITSPYTRPAIPSSILTVQQIE